VTDGTNSDDDGDNSAFCGDGDDDGDEQQM